MAAALTPTVDNLEVYMREVRRMPLLDRDQELRLAEAWHRDQDPAAAHALVVANLRFVVKVAQSYRGFGLRLLDLIQEGNLGLMIAVKKFDPSRGYRLLSYAVWWIRAQIQSYVLRSWSLVRMGSSRLQRRLFFKLRQAKARAEADAAGEAVDVDDLAKRLDAPAEAVTQMEMRLAGHDFSLDAPVGEDTATSHLDQVAAASLSPEAELQAQQLQGRVQRSVEAVWPALDDRERAVVERRLLADAPSTLAELGEGFSVSRERMRQIENKVKRRLRAAFEAA